VVQRVILADPAPAYAEFSGRTMGTTYSVKVAEPNLTVDEHTWLAREISDQLDRVDGLMSTYIDDSELSRLNRHRSPQPFAVSAEMLAVFQIAQSISQMSGGAFDITVSPLVVAWGFGASDRPAVSPDSRELTLLLDRVGFRKISLRPREYQIVKHHPETECDLSAIAKGWGVDQVAQALLARGYENFLVEVGGELRAQGRKSLENSWQVGIERPDTEVRSPHRIISLQDMALATSGDYRDYYEVDGVRVSHTIDPRLGEPIHHRLASASVLHSDAAWADALATTISVLGPEEGLAWAKEHEIAALLLVREVNGQFRAHETKAFRALQ
jgi:thiamine biosynthesis lipoprotein